MKFISHTFRLLRGHGAQEPGEIAVRLCLLTGEPAVRCFQSEQGQLVAQYDDFLNAAALLNGDVYNAKALNREGLRGLVSSNAEPLRLSHTPC